MRVKLVIVAILLAVLAAYLVIRVPVACKGCALFCYLPEHASLWTVKKHGPDYRGKMYWAVSGSNGGPYLHCLATHDDLDCALLQAALGGMVSFDPDF